MASRVRAVFGALLLASGLLVTLPTVAFAGYGQQYCRDITNQNFHTGLKLLSGSTNRDGIKATINPYLNGTHDGFRPCVDQNGLDADGNSSAWIAFEGQGNTNQILQIGVINCDNVAFSSACQDAIDNGFGTQFVAFWAMGGCGGAQPYPNGIVNFGTYGAAAHDYMIYSSGSNWALSVDKGTPSQHIVYVSKTDPAISCWDNVSTMDYAFDGERHDGGDGLGMTSSGATTFDVMGSHFPGGDWANFSFADSTCSYADNYTGCNKQLHGDLMNIWGPSQ